MVPLLISSLLFQLSKSFRIYLNPTPSMKTFCNNSIVTATLRVIYHSSNTSWKSVCYFFLKQPCFSKWLWLQLLYTNTWQIILHSGNSKVHGDHMETFDFCSENFLNQKSYFITMLVLFINGYLKSELKKFFSYAVVGTEPRNTCMWGKHSAIELHPPPILFYFILRVGPIQLPRLALKLQSSYPGLP